tara:strand:+ start:4319 stop:5458 length:1140 start_codon:yes stop_codon:yes gene_type:complete
MKVSIVVTHLLGTGHLARALTLARAYVADGHPTTVISGGMHAPQLDSQGVELIQLPPLRSDGVNFAQLLDQSGLIADDAVFSARSGMLTEHTQSTRPDILITELFPFGRRTLAAEFVALLEAAHGLPRRPLICASIRDILAPPSKLAKAERTDDLVEEFYDAVLVHADADVTPLSLSWPVSDRLVGKLHYTGYVAPPTPLPHPDRVGQSEIIVSAGGGDVGAKVFDTCLAAAKRDPKRRWRLLLGGRDAAAKSAELMRTASENIMIEPARPDFRQMLHHAAASVSLCGYNTALDVLQSGVRAVFIPFDAGNEVEQGLRADALAELTGIAVLRNAELTPDALLDSLDQVASAPPRTPRTTGFDGAIETVRWTETMRKAML